MNKKQIFVLILIILVVSIFLFPKQCDKWTTAPHSDIINKQCTCIGYKYSTQTEGTGGSGCFGIPFSYSCSYNKIENGQLTRVKTFCQ